MAGSLPAMLLRTLVDLVAPPSCVACRRPPGPLGVLCPACRAGFDWLGPDTCAACGLPEPCGRSCPARGLAFAGAWSPVAYGGPAAALVVGLKEDGVVAAASIMAGQMAALAPPGVLAGGVLVPVPAEPLRRRRRGVDHAAALAMHLGRRRDLPVARVLRRRPSSRGRRARAGRAQRLDPDRLTIGVRGRVPEVAVLVDDVHTTGATLDACARALLLRGSRKVCAVTYARTLPTGRFGRSLDGT